MGCSALQSNHQTPFGIPSEEIVLAASLLCGSYLLTPGHILWLQRQQHGVFKSITQHSCTLDSLLTMPDIGNPSISNFVNPQSSLYCVREIAPVWGGLGSESLVKALACYFIESCVILRNCFFSPKAGDVSVFYIYYDIFNFQDLLFNL